MTDVFPWCFALGQFWAAACGGGPDRRGRGRQVSYSHTTNNFHKQTWASVPCFTCVADKMRSVSDAYQSIFPPQPTPFNQTLHRLCTREVPGFHIQTFQWISRKVAVHVWQQL